MVVITEKEKSMKLTGKMYNISITEAEIEVLVRALENETDCLKETYKDGGEITYRFLTETKALRNSFAEIIDKHYMGVDA